MKRKARLAGPARKYRNDPTRHAVVRAIPASRAHAARVTRLGCRDAIAGQKDPYKPAAAGYIAAYREGYRICDAIVSRRRLTSEEARVAQRRDLEFEVKLAQRAQARQR